MKFPITSTVVEGSMTREKKLHRGDIVRCYYCKQQITVNARTVVEPDQFGNKALRCPSCKKIASILYYYDEVLK